MMDFPALKNDLFLRVLKGEKVERAPVWCMRQAGRYLPEFREIRVENEFFKVCRTPELACEVTIQPISRYRGLLDAAIIFSDILVVPQAMGLEVLMVPGKGPHFPDPLVTPSDFKRLIDKSEGYDPHEQLGYVYDAISLTRKKLFGIVPLIGFIGAPWTLMAYMIEGGGSKTFSKAKAWLWKYPEQAHELLDRVASVSIEFLKGQVRAGAQALQVFDSWAGELSNEDYLEFSFPYISKIAQEVSAEFPDIPMIVFPKGVHPETIKEIALGTKYTAISLDWTIDPKSLITELEPEMKKINKPLILQGNLDPTVLFGDKEIIQKKTESMIKQFSSTNHIANLGHGMLPNHDPEHLKWYLEAVHKYSQL
ncbi:hypothetical protein BB560_001217 [Smittium megazygosporum]|uniref:Uroporphyrinogen decarboxylase n=1 Tax=Smittium megazygosporum TaxID=133381 RepID=A0A2T9ZI79_9FUNG|nr:hypothetical protein BB560_001217 [Smittium megazygosporum]